MAEHAHGRLILNKANVTLSKNENGNVFCSVSSSFKVLMCSLYEGGTSSTSHPVSTPVCITSNSMTEVVRRVELQNTNVDSGISPVLLIQEPIAIANVMPGISRPATQQKLLEERRLLVYARGVIRSRGGSLTPR